MMSQTSIEPYTLLRAALSLFQKAPAELEQLQLRQVEVQAKNEYEIEGRVLSSSEATGVVISDTELDRAYKEVRGRFEDEDAFLAALSANGLDVELLKAALYRQCKVDAVMDRVAARAPKVNEVEIGIFYHSHPEKFHKPETRQARHILISINPDYPDNTRDAAWRRINEILGTLKRKPHKFADLALKYSECPTAVQGGEVGTVAKGTLFPELDAVLFSLKEDAISDVVETEMGFHVIQCLKIIPAETMSLKKATPKIQQIMLDRSRRTCQRTWLASLPAVNRSA
ncbi:nitrogen fixation protein NifM [Methylomonas sp. WSC-7]|uniref:Nitrogen fixation protein NifM n=2 Tax=Methylomonas rosea TaxID=2952227 RepID=A0ABT1TQ66_9GAMM|nr:nitrogen fixation protein NifM [Methylomonas sp. WSC-7]MCQ8116915.1 nitrogen fixation protein NifM [Methylomonas sp. WSC-7]